VHLSVFNKYGDFLRMYTSYVNNYQESLNCLTSLQDNKKFQRFLQKAKEKQGSNGMDLMAFVRHTCLHGIVWIIFAYRVVASGCSSASVCQ